ncbi:MAG: carbohydrate ABC transporter permease, partial [Spirochaetes bacterium]|nr:carbohydrate ABC transporter permease [Spirochaetota bacterium]
LIPQHPTIENYINGWKGFGGLTFGTFFKNSFIIATLETLFVVTSSTIVAYGFARIDFPGKNFWFSCMLATLMLPVQIKIIPQYIFFGYLKWINTFLPLIVPKLFGEAFYIFMMMQFIRGIPKELDEAAEIDGCGRFYTFTHILLPLLKPPMFTAAIFSFYWSWGDFLTPLIYLNTPKLYTLSVALCSFADPGGMTDWGAIFAMSFLSLVPVLVLFVSFQRFLTQGIASTGLKG